MILHVHKDYTNNMIIYSLMGQTASSVDVKGNQIFLAYFKFYLHIQTTLELYALLLYMCNCCFCFLFFLMYNGNNWNNNSTINVIYYKYCG